MHLKTIQVGIIRVVIITTYVNILLSIKKRHRNNLLFGKTTI